MMNLATKVYYYLLLDNHIPPYHLSRGIKKYNFCDKILNIHITPPIK